MGCMFVSEGMINPFITTIDSTLIKASGPVWYKSSIKKRIVPRVGLDTDARWGYSHTKNGWIFGYKLHRISSTGSSVIVPLSDDFTTAANIPDNQLFKILTSSLPSSKQ